MKTKIVDLKYGDVVKLFDSSYGYGTVTAHRMIDLGGNAGKVKEVEIMRPYVMLNTVTGGVGIEICKYYGYSTIEMDVVENTNYDKINIYD
jgi:hypothetical protein